MSATQYQETLNVRDLQIWNNAVFDNCEFQDSSTNGPSPIKSANPIDSIDTASSKENQSPVFTKSPISDKSPALDPNGATGYMKIKLLKPVKNQRLVEKPATEGLEKKIDTEIEEIEKEINRLSARLQVLKLKKAEQNVKLTERRGRIIPAKFMEQKQSFENSVDVKKSEESLLLSSKLKVERRGMSMGPGEIFAGSRRGLSLGPSEIVAGVRSRRLYKPEITPVQSIQNRRKSCFWKLQGIDEEKVNKERGKRLSLSPKSRKALCKPLVPRQAATTVGSRKAVKTEDGVLAAIQPKKLFGDGEKSVNTKKPLKPGRVIASRYNQNTVQSALRKKSLPENDKDESSMNVESSVFDRRRSSSVGRSRVAVPAAMSRNQSTETRIKKSWEVPTGTLACVKSQLSSISVVPDVLPKVKTTRCTIDTPRDSGPAKRVAELIGKKSYFSDGEDLDSSVCQELSFTEDD